MKVTKNNISQFLTPWKMYAEYTDGAELYFYGNSEEECIQEIADRQEEHGECTMYTGVNDEDYVDGEYVGRDNFIYE